MEMFGILFSIPIIILLSSIYIIIFKKYLSRHLRLLKVIKYISPVVLVGLGVELGIVCSIGPNAIYKTLKNIYISIHYLLFVFGVPALINVMLEIQVRNKYLKSPIIVLFSVVIWMVIVLTQYYVTEAIYGIN